MLLLFPAALKEAFCFFSNANSSLGEQPSRISCSENSFTFVLCKSLCDSHNSMFTLCHIIICDALCLKNSSWFHCHYFLSCVQRFASSSVMAILQFHLENWPGFGMTINPANKAVYINPAREPDMNFTNFLTWTYSEYSWFLPTLALFRHQHLLSYKGSKSPRSQPSSTLRALRQEETCMFVTQNGPDPSIWFNLPCTWES